MSIDTSKFDADVASNIALAITKSVALWTRSSGLSFTFAGIVPLNHDQATGVASPRDGVERARHIYVGFVEDADSPILSESVVGLGQPTAVEVANREILGGAATFESDYVRKAPVGGLVALFSHELGHVLGLGHSSDKGDVMYPLVSKAKSLGAGDERGLKAVLRPCGVTAPSRDYPMGDS